MNKLINKIFSDNNFEMIKFSDDIEFWLNSKGEVVNFFLVVYLDEIKSDFLEEKVPFYYEKIKKIDAKVYDERMDKNLSMIVLIKESSQLTQETIFNIEENPYYFKKYVLTYNNSEKNELEQLFLGSQMSANLLLSKIVNNVELFERFKEDKLNEALYSISSKLIIKIPFITLVKGEKTLKSLSSSIDSALEGDSLLEDKKYFLSLNENSENCVEKILKDMSSQLGEY